MKKAVFHFQISLRIFLKQARRASLSADASLPEGSYYYEFRGPQSVKHLIEAAGVPHTEVSDIQVNGSQVDFNYLVKDGDQVDILSFTTVQNLIEHRFILDNHLGKLASYLRMLGFDCFYQNDYQDKQLAQILVEDNRILLTRDHRLLMRKSIQQGYWLRSQNPTQQLKEVLNRFKLFHQIKPFQRCMSCNQLLYPVPKDSVLPRLEPLTQKYFDEFRLCPSCKQVYWKGSHYLKMMKFIQEIKDSQNQPFYS
jgi:uncharacterized protein with PIN domain